MAKMLLFHMGNLWVNCHCLFLVKLFGYQGFKVPLVPETPLHIMKTPEHITSYTLPQSLATVEGAVAISDVAITA